MIVVTVELHSAITGDVSQIGKVTLINDGTGTHEIGNYDVIVEVTEEVTESEQTYTGRVERFQRLKYNALDLLYQALEVYPDPLNK